MALKIAGNDSFKMKNIADLQQLDTLPSSANVIVEHGGFAKRFDASKLEGKVKTVNGVEPDENGNIEVAVADVPEINFPVTSVNGMTGEVVIEIPESFSGSWNDLTDKPFGEEGSVVTIEWDGNTEGRDNFTVDGDGVSFTWYKVGDIMPSKNELLGGTMTAFISGNPTEYVLNDDVIWEGDNHLVVADLIVIAYEAGVDFGIPVSAPSTGVYFGMADGLGYVTKLTYGSTTIHTLDEKFIPDTIARVSDIPEGTEQINPDWNQNDSTQPDYVKNRTHWVEGNQTVIEWDGNTEGRDSFSVSGTTVYKISDETPTTTDLTGGTLQVDDSPDGALTETSFYEVEGGFSIADNVIVVQSADTFAFAAPSTGVYAAPCSTLTLTYGFTTIHTLDEKFIPDTIARSADIPEVNYPVTSVNGMTGDVVIEAGSGGGVTSWNDLEDRPFGEEANLTELYADEDLEFTEDSGVYGVEVSQLLDIDVDKTYLVKWDGVEYERVAASVNDGQLYMLGNQSIFGGDDTGEPFLIQVYPSGGIVFVTKETSATHSVGLYEKTTVIHKIDAKFLPESCMDYTLSPSGVIHWDGDSTNRDTVDMSGNNSLYDGQYLYTHVGDNIPNESDLSGAIIRLTNLNTSETRTLTIESEGCTTATIAAKDDNTIIVSDGDGKEICFISSIDNNACYTNYVFPKAGIYFVTTSTEYVSMLDYNTDSVDKISVEYLPKFDRHETVVIEWYDDITDNVSFTATTSIGEATLYQATPDNIKYSDVIGAEVTIIDESTGEEEVKVISEDDIEQFDGGYFADMFAVSLRNDAVYNSNTLFAGVYLARFSDTKHVKSVKYHRAIERDLTEEINHLSIKLDSTYREATKVHSWNDLTDKPFTKENISNTIEWDGTTSGRDTFERGIYKYYKICDLADIPNNATFVSAIQDGSTYNSPAITEGVGAVIYGSNLFAVVTSESFTIGTMSFTAGSTGLYFSIGTYNNVSYTTTSVTYEYESTILDNNCLPKAATVSDATGETVTAAEFNALLAALREAGYLAT